MATDGEVLAELLCMIDNNPRPSLLFGAPALSVSQVETNLSLPPGALEAGRLKAIIEPLADSLFDKPRKVTVRDLHRGGNVEFWIVFEELALAERPWSAPKLAKLPPPSPHPQIASRQAKGGLDDRLRAVALQDAFKAEPDRKPDVDPPDSSAFTSPVSEMGRDTQKDIADAEVVEPSGECVAKDITAQDQEQGSGEQNSLFAPAPKQAVSAGFDNQYDQVEPSAPLEPNESVSPPQERAMADLIIATDPIDIIPEVNEDPNLVDVPSPPQATRYDLKQAANLDEDADGPTSYAAQSPVDAFEFDMVDLLSPADVADSFPIEMPRVDDVSLEVERPPQGGQLYSPSPLLTPAVSPKWEPQALAPIAAPGRVSTGDTSPHFRTTASGRYPRLEGLQPAGLVVDLDLPKSSTSSDDQFEFEVGESSSSSPFHDGQGSVELQPVYSPDEAIEDRQSLHPKSDDVKRAPEPASVDIKDVDGPADMIAQVPRASFKQQVPLAGLDRAPQLAHYTSPLPSPLYLAERAQALRPSTPPLVRELVVQDDEYSFGSPVSQKGLQDPRVLRGEGQSPEEEIKWYENNQAQSIPMTASTTSDRNSSFSLDHLLPSPLPEQVDLASAQDSPLSPPPTFTVSLATSPVPATMAVEDPEDAIQETHSSPPTSPARTDVSGSEYESDSAPRRSATRNPPQIMQNDNNPSRDAPDSSVPTIPAGGNDETPPVTPFVDKVFRDLPFAPRLPPALQPEALRQHGHWLAYELVAVLVVFLLLIPA